MEQTSTLSNSGFRIAVSAILLWVAVSILAVIALAYGYSEKPTNKQQSISPQEQFVFVSEFEVAGARLESNSGDALIRLGEFNIPVKFNFESSPVVSITNLEIGDITDTNGKGYNDFTNHQDHQAINSALVAYITKRREATIQ